jgi:hypothetical protein
MKLRAIAVRQWMARRGCQANVAGMSCVAVLGLAMPGFCGSPFATGCRLTSGWAMSACAWRER